MNKVKSTLGVLILLFSLLSVMAPSINVMASTATVYASYDTQVDSMAPDSNYNSGEIMILGRRSGYIERIFLKFDFSSYTGKIIDSAKLYIYAYSGSAAIPNGIDVYRATASYTSSTITWNNMPATTSTGINSGNEFGYPGWEFVNITSLVQGYADEDYTNYGISLRSAQEGSNYRVYCRTIEYDGGSVKPYVAIIYHDAPPPGWKPTVTTTPGDIAWVDQEYSYTADTNESTNATCLEKPSWASSSDSNFTVSGTPTLTGDYNFSLSFESVNGTLYEYQNWTVSVYDFVDLVGVVDTTALVFAIDAYVNGVAGSWGANMNFPDDSGDGFEDVTTLRDFWHSYFWCMEYYGLNLLRTGANDAWATELMHQAWKDDHAKYYDVIEEMLHEAEEHNVFLEITLAGSQEWPIYDFDGSADPFDHDHNYGTAYRNYYTYCSAVITMVDTMDNDALLAYDMWNEPDHNQCDSNYWAGAQDNFQDWASEVSADFTPLTSHLVDMGVAGVATLWDWNYASFKNSTGTTGFDICHWHYYASAEDEYLVTDPLNWSASSGKTLFVGEVAENVGGLERWYWYEARFSANGGEMLCNMVLDGTPNYPYTGEIPEDVEGEIPDPDPDPFPEDEWEIDLLTDMEWTTYATIGFLFAAVLIVWQSTRRS